MSSSTFSSGPKDDAPSDNDVADTSGAPNGKQADNSVVNQLFRVNPDLKSGLYVVSTPIGNLRDISLRALDILASVDLVLAEDTRVARKLLSAFGLNPTLRPYHDHNGAKVRPDIIESLLGGQRVALISDAGTPLVSDPGFKLARDAIEAGADVTAIPGASAPLAALTISGLPSDRFLFAGFPPPKSSARLSFLEKFKDIDATLIFFEGGSRLGESLQDMAKSFGARPAAICRELTKKFEEAIRAPLDELASTISEEGPPRGELVVLVGPPDKSVTADQSVIDAAIIAALQEMPVKSASNAVAEQFGLKKRDVYARALALKDGNTH